MNALAISGYPFVIGYQGENLVRTVRFRISEWKKEFPSGTATLLHKRSEDTDAYPVAVSVVGDYAEWTVATSDVQYVGNGDAQLLWSVGNKVVKSEVFTTITLASLDQDENPPEAWQAWVDQVASSVSHYPKIDTATKHWLVWANGDWQDTGVTAEGSDASVTRESIEDALGVSSPNLSTNDYTTAEKTKLAGINLAAYRTASAQDAIDSTKADSDDVYGRTYLDSKFATKADADSVYDKEEVDEALSDKADDADVIKGVKVAGTELTKGADGKVNLGLVETGLGVISDGRLFIKDPNENFINARTCNSAITGHTYDYAVKAAMCDGVGAAWTDAEKLAARKRIGENKYNVVFDETLEEHASKISIELDSPDYTEFLIQYSLPSETGYFYFCIGTNDVLRAAVACRASFRGVIQRVVFLEGNRLFGEWAANSITGGEYTNQVYGNFSLKAVPTRTDRLYIYTLDKGDFKAGTGIRILAR